MTVNVARVGETLPQYESMADDDQLRSGVQPDVLAVIALGGMIGATARFEIAQATPHVVGEFPWATFWTNISGSFVLAFLLIILLERFAPTPHLRPFLATGILGAYTTMSTYLVEVAVLIRDGHTATGLAYGVSSLLFGLGVSYLGIVLARLLPWRRPNESAR